MLPLATNPFIFVSERGQRRRHKPTPLKCSITLTKAGLRLIEALWSRGKSAGSDMVSAVADASPLAYTTVLTTVRILEKKGYVRHRQANARATAEQLIKQGKVDHGYLGIPADAPAAIVSQVTPDLPAARAGLKQDDVITSWTARGSWIEARSRSMSAGWRRDLASRSASRASQS